MAQNDSPTFWLLGLPVDCITMEQAKARIISAARTRTRLFFATPNVNFLALANRNPSFREAVLRTDLSLVDGMPLVWIARLLGIPVPERVAGSNLIEELLAEELTPPLRVFFFGGAPGVAAAACARVNELQGGLLAVGWHDPGFKNIEKMSDAEVITRINSSGADILILALGAEKGHLWIERNRDLLTVPVISHLGAVVNFLAEAVRRAPKGFQRLGLEWAWRIREEPALAGRYARDFFFIAKELLTAVVPLIYLRSRRYREAHEMTIEIKRPDSGCPVYELSGALDSMTVPRLEEAIASAGALSLKIDLRGLLSIDSRALGYLYELEYRRPDSIRLAAAIPASLIGAQLKLHRARWLESSTARCSSFLNS